MSEKTRKKKDGHEANKDRQAMREAVQEREKPRRHDSGDQKDLITYKSGSAGDRTRQGAT